MHKQYLKIIMIFLSFFLLNNISFSALFSGHPSGSKKCEGGYWPTFTTQKQILNLFDEDWEKLTISNKKGIQKTFYFNLIGLTKPKQTIQISRMSESELQALQDKIDIKLVPYRQDKKYRKEVCHYAFRLKGVPDTLVQIGRVETLEDQDKFTRNGLLIKGLENHLHDLSSALTHLAPAISSTITAGIQISTAGLPETPDDLQTGLDVVSTPAAEAASHWADFFNALFGLNDDEDAQI